MVAILGGLIAFLVFVVAGMLATIQAQREEIHDLRTAAKPPTTPPLSVIRAREDNSDRETDPGLPPLFDLEGNDEPTKVCRIVP